MNTTDTSSTQDILATVVFLADWRARGISSQAAHLARLDALADAVVVGVDDPNAAVGLGQMYWDEELLRPGQIARAVEDWSGTFRELYGLVLTAMRIGGKFDPYCLYAAVPRWPGSCLASNMHHGRVLTVDIDGCRDAAECQRVLQVCSQWATIAWSTFSHDPAAGSWRLRVIILMSHATRTVEEHRRVAARVCQLLRELTGVSEIDPCTKKVFQPALPPAWKDEAAKAMAILPTLSTGPAYATGEMLTDVRAEISAEKAADEAHKAALAEAKATFVSVDSSATVKPIVADGSVDPVEGARQDLAALPIRSGCGERNEQSPRAVGICREWGLDEHAAVQVLEDHYGRWPDDPTWWRRWVRTIYSHADTRSRDGRRLAAAQRSAQWAGVVGVAEFDLDGYAGPDVAPTCDEVGPHDPSLNSIGSHVDQATKVGEQDVDQDANTSGPHAGPHPAPPTATNLPPPLRTIGGIPVVLTTVRYLPELQDVRLQRTKLLGVKSPCGTGKSFTIRLAIHRALQRGERVVVVVPRRALARALAADLGLPCYLDQVGDIDGSTVVCLDSVHRVVPYTFALGELDKADIGLLVLDEVQQLVRHAFGGTLRKKLAIDRCWKAMRKLCAAADKIRASDAGLDPLAAHILRGWVGPDASAEILENLWRPSRPICTFVRRSETQWLKEIHKAVGEGRKAWIYFTSRRRCNAIAKRLAAKYPGKKVLVVNSENTGGEARACMQDPRRFAAYDIVCTTSTVGTGVSVEHEDTWAVFGHCVASRSGPLAADVYQGLSRVRAPVGDCWHLCLRGTAPRTSDDEVEHLADLVMLTKDTRARLDGITDWDDVRFGVSGAPEIVPENPELLQAYARVLAYQGRYGGNFHDRVHEDGTREDGAIRRYWSDLQLGQVVDLDDLDEQRASIRTPHQEAEEKAEVKDLAEALKEVDAESDARVAAAPHVTHEEAERLAASEERTPETVAMIRSEQVRHRYGLDELTADDAAWDRENWGQAVTFADTFIRQEGERQALLAGDAKAGGCSLHWRHTDQQTELLEALWRRCGIMHFENDAKAGTVVQSPGPILQRPSIRDGLRRVLGLTFRGDQLADGMYLVRSLARKCGLRLRSTRPRQADGTRRRVYTLDVDRVQELLGKTAAHRRRRKDPKAKPVKPVQMPGMPTQEQLAELLRVINDEVDAFGQPVPRAA